MSKMNKKGISLYVRTIQEGDLAFVGFGLGFLSTTICLK